MQFQIFATSCWCIFGGVRTQVWMQAIWKSERKFSIIFLIFFAATAHFSALWIVLLNRHRIRLPVSSERSLLCNTEANSNNFELLSWCKLWDSYAMLRIVLCCGFILLFFFVLCAGWIWIYFIRMHQTPMPNGFGFSATVPITPQEV